jgi:hypothetical protein
LTLHLNSSSSSGTLRLDTSSLDIREQKLPHLGGM